MQKKNGYERYEMRPGETFPLKIKEGETILFIVVLGGKVWLDILGKYIEEGEIVKIVRKRKPNYELSFPRTPQDNKKNCVVHIIRNWE